MTQVRSTSAFESLFQFSQVSEFEDYIVECSAVDVFELQLFAYEANVVGGTVSGLTLYLSGSSNNNPIQSENPIPSACITTSANASVIADGLLSLADPSPGQSIKATVSIANPPRWLTVRIAATTFPSSIVGSQVGAQASWR